MSTAPIYDIDVESFWRDPYPDLKALREKYPIAYVPQLGSFLLTRREDVFANEKKVDVFSSDQPDGLMQKLMGQNMMRKDGKDHAAERKAIFPTVSPKTVKSEWKTKFQLSTDQVLNDVQPIGQADMVRDIAMRICGEALKIVTGLTNITWKEMDRISQGMIDGCANYSGNPEIEANCHDCTNAVDSYIDQMIPVYAAQPNHSLLSVQMHAGMPDSSIRANIKLAISGGQNEPRDVISGAIWALLKHPEQFDMVKSGHCNWGQVFNEYARWISPVGMSPRRVAKKHMLHNVQLNPGDRLFLMFGSANRDERAFTNPENFDLRQDSSASVTFGAGPHFCAGAAISKCLVAEVALPTIFDRLAGLELAGETAFGGWAFRGPLKMPVKWSA